MSASSVRLYVPPDPGGSVPEIVAVPLPLSVNSSPAGREPAEMLIFSAPDRIGNPLVVMVIGVMAASAATLAGAVSVAELLLVNAGA